MEIIGVIIAGVVIGLLGKFVAPGNKDNIPIWLTIICGIGGVLIGWYIYAAFGGGAPQHQGVDAAVAARRRRRRTGRRITALFGVTVMAKAAKTIKVEQTGSATEEEAERSSANWQGILEGMRKVAPKA